MFIAIIGTRSSGWISLGISMSTKCLPGKRTVLKYLVSRGFTPINCSTAEQSIILPSAVEILNHVTTHWRENFVMILESLPMIANFERRPFFMLISIDAPLLQRYDRSLGLVLFLGAFI